MSDMRIMILNKLTYLSLSILPKRSENIWFSVFMGYTKEKMWHEAG